MTWKMPVKAKFTPEDYIKLIQLVRAHDVLYDPTHKDYHDAPFIRNIWKSIADALNIPGFKEEDAKRKWRNLRDTYQKVKKKMLISKSGRNWRWYSHMDFLSPFSEGRGNDTNIASDSPSAAQSDEDQDQDHKYDMDDRGINLCTSDAGLKHAETPLDNLQALSTTDAMLAHTETHLKTFSKSTIRKRKYSTDTSTSDSAVAGLLDDIRRVVRRSGQTTHSKDADDYFFESCALRSKKLPPQIRSVLHVQVTQLFLNAENPGLPPVSIMPLPSDIYVQQSQPDPGGVGYSEQSVTHQGGDCGNY